MIFFKRQTEAVTFCLRVFVDLAACGRRFDLLRCGYQLVLLCYVESNMILLNFIPQKLQNPVALTSQGWIRRRIRSQVTPEVFFGAGITGEDEQIGERRENQVMVKTAPRPAFKMIQAQVVFGTLEVLLDLPAGTAQLQAARP